MSSLEILGKNGLPELDTLRQREAGLIKTLASSGTHPIHIALEAISVGFRLGVLGEETRLLDPETKATF